MDDQLKNEIFKAWNINGLSQDQKIVKLFEKVRDIPFGRMGSRDPRDVYEKNKGTCSGKNFLLKELYEGIGVKTKDMVCLQRWKDLTWFPDDIYSVVKLPDELKEILEANEIVDFHNYLKIFVDDKWVTVDVTIDLPLKKLGFYTTEKWDGKSDMPLCFVGTHKVWDCGDKGLEKKLELTKNLPLEFEEERVRFLQGLTKWLDGLRAEGEI
jgi:hypothetical protein